MSETASDITVKITAEPRAHPAIRQLARACIALARQRHGQVLTTPEQSGEGSPAGEERADD